MLSFHNVPPLCLAQLVDVLSFVPGGCLDVVRQFEAA